MNNPHHGKLFHRMSGLHFAVVYDDGQWWTVYVDSARAWAIDPDKFARDLRSGKVGVAVAKTTVYKLVKENGQLLVVTTSSRKPITFHGKKEKPMVYAVLNNSREEWSLFDTQAEAEEQVAYWLEQDTPLHEITVVKGERVAFEQTVRFK